MPSIRVDDADAAGHATDGRAVNSSEGSGSSTGVALVRRVEGHGCKAERFSCAQLAADADFAPWKARSEVFCGCGRLKACMRGREGMAAECTVMARTSLQ